MANLRDFKIHNGVTPTRFCESEFKCPQCGVIALDDTWPPNIGMMTCYDTGHGGISKVTGNMKCVCVSCRISFNVYYHKVHVGSPQTGSIDEEEIVTSDVVSLAEKNDELLTPYDVWEDEYFDEHGEKPNLIYG